MDNCSVSSHHTDLSLLAGAGGADEHLQLNSELLILTKNLVELLHEVLGFSSIWQILCKHKGQLYQDTVTGKALTILKKLQTVRDEKKVCIVPYWQYSSASQTWLSYWLRTVTGKSDKKVRNI